MRKKPDSTKKEEDFIKAAKADIAEKNTNKEDLHHYVQAASWPINGIMPSPSLADGSNLRKPLILNITEKEWNSIDRHVKALGITKTNWLRKAIFQLMEEEQLYFFKNKNRVS